MTQTYPHPCSPALPKRADFRRQTSAPRAGGPASPWPGAGTAAPLGTSKEG